MFELYKYCFFNEETMVKTQQRFKSDYRNVYTEEINKIALSSNDDKRIQTFDGITTYPYSTSNFKICESEMLVRKKDIPIILYYDKI